MPSAYRGSVIGSLQRLFEAGTVTALPDMQLLERFITAGDESAFEAILLRHGPMVLQVCQHVLADPHDVDDAFQATFLILVKKAGSIRDRDLLATWLYGVARRVAVRARIDARRRQARERTGVEGMDVADQRVHRADAGEIRALIDEALERLPKRYRAPLVLCDLEGQTHEQAAAQLKCPVGTIKSRLSRGRERLRAQLVRRGLAIPAGPSVSTQRTQAAPTLPVDLLNRTTRAATQLATGRAVAAGMLSTQATALVEGVIRSMFVSKLKIAAAAVLAASLTVAGLKTLVSPRQTQAAPAAQDAAATRRESKGESPKAPEKSPRPAEPGSERFQLENGLTVILRPIRETKTTALIVLYSIGSDHDPEGRSGLAHMVEHLYVTAAAGQEKARTAEEYARQYPEGVNAQTGEPYTVFAASFPAEDLDRELADASARMGSLRVTATDLERERPRLLEEIANMFGEFPHLAALNNAIELARPTTRGGRRGGSPESIRAITPEEVQAHWERYYKPRNAILALSGAVDAVAVRKAISAHFAKLAPGQKVSAPGKPGQPKYGTVRELTVQSPLPDAKPTACLAYPAPEPGSDLYVPFLVLVMRFWAAAAKLGDSGPTGSPVYFTPLDDGTVVAFSIAAKPGETAAQAYARIEAFVAETLEPKLRPFELTSTRQQLGLFLGTAELPDNLLAQNPYGVAFSLGRREQLGIDPVKLNRALQAVTDQDLRRVAAEVFAPARHTGAFISISK